jgi:hypothetical protein
MEGYSLNQTLERLIGPTPEEIKVKNFWAAIALDRFHANSTAEIQLLLDGKSNTVLLNWESNFSKSTMKEGKDIAHFGAIGLAWFVMSVLLDYSFVEQTEIGDGVDYRFSKTQPSDDDLNFLDDHHYVEISGILEESKTNTLRSRMKEKHDQINKGGKREELASVIVTLFSTPQTVKEVHG